MTSEEIRNVKQPPSEDLSFVYVIQWLKEIAYQLAVMNEARANESTGAQDDEIPQPIVDAVKAYLRKPHYFTLNHLAGSASGISVCAKCFKAESECEPGEVCPGMVVPDPNIPGASDIKPDWFATIQARELAKRTDREQNS